MLLIYILIFLVVSVVFEVLDRLKIVKWTKIWSLKQVWTLYNALQLIVILMAFNVELPAGCTEFLQHIKESMELNFNPNLRE